jgi:molybdopterin/thiamine biosynthesis adenylyltransferase
MGVGELNIWDADVVDPINLATQMHRLLDVEKYKVDAVKEMLAEFSDDTEVLTDCRRVTAEDRLYNYIVISAVDSIQARKDIWEAVCRGGVSYYLDARMAAEEFHLHVIDMNGDVSWYDTMLVAETDENVSEEPCTSKATIYCSFLSAAILGKTIRQIATNERPPRIFIQNLRNDALTVIP